MKECTEVENKTVRKLTIFDDEAKSREVVIEFSDGSVFSAAFNCDNIRTSKANGRRRRRAAGLSGLSIVMWD
jgi:hypothetical protein